MANLFTGDISQVTLSDVEQFLNLNASPSSRATEGPRLDFKQDVPQDLGWHVAGLANTYGGILLIGIETDKTRKNVPNSISGADLGNDPRARLTDKILASVHPRPDFEVHAIATSNPQRRLAVVRVAAGTYPPYESSRGANPGIPVRIGDTTRQATLQEIEALLKNREAAGREPEEVVKAYLEDSSFYCSIEATGSVKTLVRDPQFHKLLIVPRVLARLRLDSVFEQHFSELVRKVYRGEQNFMRAKQAQTYNEGFHRYSRVLVYQFRISARAPCHRVWRVWSDGALGFVANHSRSHVPEPAGNFALEALLFLRLAHCLFEIRGYFGPSVIAYQISCPSHKFGAEFPIPDLEFTGHYDGVHGLHFDGPSTGQASEATSVEDLTWDTLLRPEEVVATILLEQFRAIAGARIDYQMLLSHVTHLSQNFP
jgi:hypothetical protein